MRTTKSTTQKDIWNVRMILDGNETYNKNFKTMTEIAEDLGMSYNQVSDLKCKRSKRKQIRFKFSPEIIFTRLSQTQKEYWNERRLLKAKQTLEESC